MNMGNHPVGLKKIAAGIRIMANKTDVIKKENTA
jgi:hypothetical protein